MSAALDGGTQVMVFIYVSLILHLGILVDPGLTDALRSEPNRRSQWVAARVL